MPVWRAADAARACHGARWLVALICAVVALTGSGFAAGQTALAADGSAAPAFVPPPPGSVVLLLHLPAVEPAYSHRDATVQSMVESALGGQGYRVVTVDPDDYQLALRAERAPLEASGRELSRDALGRAEARALALVARAATGAVGSPLFLRTRLLTRPAAALDHMVSWDGVIRPIVYLDAERGRVTVRFEGTATGVSVELLALGADGRLLVRSYGGIALPFAIRGRDLPVDAPMLFTRPQLEEGVGLALAPLRRP